MKWRKLGKIFDPGSVQLWHGPGLFAQSPQALVLTDRVRVFFSTRVIDSPGKYLSHVTFVDFDRNMREVLGVATKPVISLGKLGCFDEHGIFPMSVFAKDDLVYGYTCGWSRRVAVPVETAIGLSVSRDNGETFARMGDGPILAASLHEPCLVGDGFVRVFRGQFHMWYIFGTGWKRYAPGLAPDRTYKIGHATSADGVTWLKEEGRQIVADRLGAEESQALPSVIQIADRFHMFFCYRESYDFRLNAARGYRIGHASSEDLVNWTRDDEEFPISVSEDGWDSKMLCYPHAFECDGRVYLLYNGNEFGRHGFGAAVLE